MSEEHNTPAAFTQSSDDGSEVSFRLTGPWKGAEAQSVQLAQAISDVPHGVRISLSAAGVSNWDTHLVVTLWKAMAERSSDSVVLFDFPPGAERLLKLAAAVPARKGAHRSERRSNFIFRVGSAALAIKDDAVQSVGFLGEVVQGVARLLRGRAQFQVRDLFVFIDECGPQALPIVTLISILVGLILAFIGIVQLQQFGAQIYVANLVGIAMAREMGAVMAGIILAGRTGAAFAAQLGTMQVNEEIDAFKTLGIPPVDFLVLPRLLALAVMMPLLCMYADVLGVLGGTLIAVGAMGISPTMYLNQTIHAVTTTDISIGIAKSIVFGILVAFSGCMRGMQSGRSASAVGDAATSAVVTAIIWIVITDAIFAVLCNMVGV